MPAFCLVLSSTLKMEAVSSSETSVNFYHNTLCDIPQESILQSHRCGNLKFNTDKHCRSSSGVGNFEWITDPIKYETGSWAAFNWQEKWTRLLTDL
jgi:hypothetical protein